MSNQLNESIKTIARTKELTEKVDKVTQNTVNAIKEVIRTVRVTAPQLGNVTTGYNGSDDTTAGATDAAGAAIDAPLAPAPITETGAGSITTAATNTGSQYANAGNNDSIQYPFTPKNYNPSALPTNQDFSIGGPNSGGGSVASGATGSAGGGSRTDAKNQADPANATGDTADKIAAVMSSDQYAAASSDVQAKMLRDIVSTEPGQHEVGGTYNGTEGPTIATGVMTNSSADGTTSSDSTGALSSLVTSSYDALNVLVGVDPDDPSVGVIIRLDGRAIVPSATEAATAEQAEWNSLEVAPVKSTFTQGMFWTIVGGYTGPTILGQAFDEVISAREAKNGSTAYSLNGSNIVLAGRPSPTSTYIGFSTLSQTVGLAFSGGTIYALDHFSTNRIEQLDCLTNGNPSVCLLAPPREAAWPIVSAYAIRYVNGAFRKYQYDSEVPLKYSNPSNYVELKSAITGDVYSLESAIGGGFLLSNKTTPDYFLHYNADRSLTTPPQPISLINFYKPK